MHRERKEVRTGFRQGSTDTKTRLPFAAAGMLTFLCHTAWAAGGAGGEESIPLIWWLAPVNSILALVAAYMFYKNMIVADEGDERMIEIAQHVRDGAYAYLRQQYKVVGIFFVIAVVMLIVVAFGLHAQHGLVPFAFLTGGFFSGLAGFLGMKTATAASSRTTAGALATSSRAWLVGASAAGAATY